MKPFTTNANLHLEGDSTMVKNSTVEAYLNKWAGQNEMHLGVEKTIMAIFAGAPVLANRLLYGKLLGDPGLLAGDNADGDKQKRIDIGAHKLFVNLLCEAGVASILSEEEELPISGAEDGSIVVAIDPLDGSENINVGAPVGTIFSLFPVAQKGKDHFLRKGNEQIAAGFITYGHTVDCVFSVGEGIIMATLNPEDGQFYITAENVKLAPQTSSLAFNASVYRYVSNGMRAYIDACWQGKDGIRGKNFNMRWLGSLVGESYRIFSRGGLFFYINDNRKGYEKGRLRLIYEALPMAFLAREAGGFASNGKQALLECAAQNYHERSPLIYGANEEVETVLSYLAEK